MVINQKIIKDFENYLIDEEKAEATVEKYVRDVRSFMVWSGGKDADKKTILAYKKHICEIYLPASVNSILSSLNSFFEFCGESHLKVKILKIQKQLFSEKEKELTRQEYKRLLNSAKRNKKLYYLMQTICGCGIRVSELKFITVEAIREKKAQIKCKGKMRTIIIPDSLCTVLGSYIKKERILSGPVFCSKSGDALDRSVIWRMMKSLCASAGVDRKKVFPHNLRHLFARTFYSIQKDIVRLADILGHSSVNTTRIYTMESGDEHRRQIQNLGLIVI